MRTRVALGEPSALESILMVALELSARVWKVVFCDWSSGRRLRVDVQAWDRLSFEQQLARAKQRFGLDSGVRVISCQEAGRDGFSIHHYLESLGVESLVVDAASMSVNRKQRRAKTDRLDAESLMEHLVDHVRGKRGVWRVLHVPDEQAEDRRHLHREMEALKSERTRVRNRLHSFLALHGLRMRVGPKLAEQLAELRRWDGSELPVGVKSRMQRLCERLVQIERQLRQIDAERELLIKSSVAKDIELVRRLLALRSLGKECSWYLAMECFAYRHFTNGKQVGAYPGLTPTPYASGQSRREQGIGKDGNQRLRWVMIELAWLWQRWQPDSALTIWFRERFGAGKRHRRIGIVALARKLIVALWRYVEHGIVPAGAVLKA
jgi:transposase